MLRFNATDLYVDEAQYWLWGQDLDWGYYSKPPLIGWILRLSTEIGTSDPFWIRAPLPILHAATAVTLAFVGRKLFGAGVGALAGLAYVTLPAVALGSLLVSTDTPMLLFFTLALLAQLHLVEQRSTQWALVLGGAVGAGLMAKYAMVYFPLCAAIAAILGVARIAWRDATIACFAALVVVGPNLVWNAVNGFTTLRHTGDNADWQGLQVNLPGLAEFLGGQFAIAGPVLFAAYLIGLAFSRSHPKRIYLAAMSVPIFGIVSFQALQSGANANWAAAAHLAAVLMGTAVLWDRPKWLGASFVINGAITLALPVATVFAQDWRLPSGEFALERYIGRSDISRHIAEVAQTEGFDTVVAENRGFLADMFHTLRDSDLTIRAVPVDGFAPHHYALKFPLEPGDGSVLYVDKGDDPPKCVSGVEPVQVALWHPEVDSHAEEVTAWRVDRSCWTP